MKPTLTEDVYGVEFLTTQILGRFSSLPAKETLDPDPYVSHQTKDPDVNKNILESGIPDIPTATFSLGRCEALKL